MILLLVLHHIADVAFQPSWLIKNKSLHWWSVYEHCVVWAGLISFGLWYLGHFQTYDFFILLAGHFIIDATKYWRFPDWKYIYLDQGLHYLQIFLAWKF